jgi:hypothetical protein
LKPQNTILEELKDIAPKLLETGVRMPYFVQDGYFDQLGDTILEKATIGLLPNSLNNSYQVPDTYFSGLASKILERVKEINVEETSLYDENESIAPILNTLPKAMPYIVPANYFEQLTIQIPVERAKVVPMKKMRNWMTYAAAAVFVGIMVTGSFLFSDKQQAQDFEKFQNMDVAAALDQVSDSELNSYIDENHANSVDDLTDIERVNLDNVDDKIQSMSTENLSDYLNENGFLEMKSESQNKK